MISRSLSILSLLVVLLVLVASSLPSTSIIIVTLAQQSSSSSLSAILSLSPTGTWTVEQLKPISKTTPNHDDPNEVLNLPPSDQPISATVRSSVSRQPLLGIEVEIVAAIWNSTSSSPIVLETWQSLDPLAPALPIFVNNRNFTNSQGVAIFPSLTAVRGCLPVGTQLVARTLYNSSLRSPVFNPALASAQTVQIQVAPSRSVCSGKILTLGETISTSQLMNSDRSSDLKVLDRIASAISSSVVTSAKSLEIRNIIYAYVNEKLAAATTTSATQATAPSTSLDPSATTQQTTTTTSTTTDLPATPPPANTSTSTTSTTTTVTSTTTTSTTTTSMAPSTSSGASTATPAPVFPRITYEAATGYKLPIRSIVLDTCGKPTAGFILADRAAASRTTTGDDEQQTNAPSSSSTEEESTSASSLLRQGWIGGSLLYETRNTTSSTSSSNTDDIATFDWVVLTSEISDVKTSFFLPHSTFVNQRRIAIHSLDFAEFTSYPKNLPAPLANESTANYICDTQTIGIDAITSASSDPRTAQQQIQQRARSLYGVPEVEESNSRPDFEVEQQNARLSLLPIINEPYDRRTVDTYLSSSASASASSTASSSSLPRNAPEWFYQFNGPNIFNLSSSQIVSSTSSTTLSRQQQSANVATIDKLHFAFSRFSVSLPLAALSTSTLRGAVFLESLERPQVSPYAVPLLKRLLEATKSTTIPVTVSTVGNVRLESISVKLEDLDNVVAIDFTRQNPVAQVDPRPIASDPLRSMRVRFTFRQDVIFPPMIDIRSLFEDIAMFSIRGSPIVLFRDDGKTTQPPSTTAAPPGFITTAAPPSTAVYSFVETSVVYPSSNETVTILPATDNLYGLRAAFDYISFLSLFGRKMDPSVIAVTRYNTRTCRSDTYMQYDVSLHPLQFVFAGFKSHLGPGLNFAVSTLVGNFMLIFFVLSTEAIWYCAIGRDSSPFPLFSLRISKFLYGGTALAMVHANQFTPNIAATFASGLSSFAFMLGVPIALAALALRAQLNWKMIFMFQPTVEDQKKALALQKSHGGQDDTLALMKNRMLISLGYGDVVSLNSEDIVSSDEAAANAVHLGWVGFVLQRLFLPPGHFILSHRDHFRARAVFERYRSSDSSKQLWLFAIGEMIFQLLLAMSYALSDCSLRFGMILALHFAKLLAVAILLPLLSMIDNLMVITISALVVASVVFELRGEIERSEITYSICVVLIGLTNLLDALAAVGSSKRIVALIIKQKRKVAAEFNRFANPDLFLKLRLWCGLGLAMLMVRQREAGIELAIDRKQIRQLLLRGGEEGPEVETSGDGDDEEEMKKKIKDKRKVLKNQKSDEDNLLARELEEELLHGAIGEQEFKKEKASSSILFDDNDLLTKEERKIRRIIEADARSASAASKLSSGPNSNSSFGNNNNNNNNSRSASANNNNNNVNTTAGVSKNNPTKDETLDSFFDDIARQFASEGEKSSKWKGKRPNGARPVWDKSAEGEQRYSQRFDFADRSDSRTTEDRNNRADFNDYEEDGLDWSQERERQRRLRTLDDHVALDRFMEGDETALDHSPEAELKRPWVDPSLFQREEDSKLSRAFAAAEARKRGQKVNWTKEEIQQQEEALNKMDPLLLIQHLQRMNPDAPILLKDIERFKNSNSSRNGNNNNNNNNNPYQGGEADDDINLDDEPLLAGGSPTTRSSTTKQQPAVIRRKSEQNSNNTFGDLSNATVLKTSSGQVLYVPPSEKQIREFQRQKAETEAAIYNLRHFYHNCSAKAQREVDEMLMPMEKELFESGKEDPMIEAIRTPIPQSQMAAKSTEELLRLHASRTRLNMQDENITEHNNDDGFGGGGRNSRLAATINRHARRLQEMKEDPTLYVPPFEWQDPKQQRKIEKAATLHPLISSALNPGGGKFISKLGLNRKTGQVEPTISKIRVRKIAEVEDEVGNPIAGRVVVDDPVPDMLSPTERARRQLEMDLFKRKQEKKEKQALRPRKGKNNIKKLLLAAMFQSDDAGQEGVLVNTQAKKKVKRANVDYFSSSDDEDENPDNMVVMREKREGKMYKNNENDDDNDDDSEDEIAVQYNPMGGEQWDDKGNNKPMAASSSAAAASSQQPMRSSQKASRNQLQEVFRQADKRDRRLARQSYGVQSMLAQARLYALAGDSVKLTELSQYDPNWFSNGRSIAQEAENQEFVGSQAAAIAARIREERGVAPAPLMRINVDPKHTNDASSPTSGKNAPTETQIILPGGGKVVGKRSLGSFDTSEGSGYSGMMSKKKSSNSNNNNDNANSSMHHAGATVDPFHSPTARRYKSTFIPKVSRSTPSKPTNSQLR